jgi:hypothetical protein
VKNGAEAEKEADLLCGDSIVNYKTVQSFGHEEAIYKMYENILLPNLKMKSRYSFKTALAMGLNEFIKFCVLGGYFWIGAELIAWYDGKIDTKAVMGAIFLIMFASINAA